MVTIIRKKLSKNEKQEITQTLLQLASNLKKGE